MHKYKTDFEYIFTYLNLIDRYKYIPHNYIGLDFYVVINGNWVHFLKHEKHILVDRLEEILCKTSYTY